MAEEENKQDQYVVLARKYRPQNFDDLVGQDALVQTLTNAIKNNRLHHAYILTGIRGVGKTTTARIIAKALNCTGKDGRGGPTVHPCGFCENCRAITEGRHIDVMELDAASRTGVDDMREILDGVRYKPTNARYKIYIIDEVHMLSKSAFNALLKTLEEPPSHVMFIFATTEIRKVPVTILSRCQRFDLQRISIEDLVGLFKKILTNEKIEAEEEALRLIAKAADGSARDGESLLDQAISLGGGKVQTDVVKNMIGLSDKNRTFELFENLIKGDVAEVLKNLEDMYKNGANPLTLLQDLINTTHGIAKVKLIAEAIKDPALSENERSFYQKSAPEISIAVLSRMWQMMIKGLSELNIAPVQIDALEMILIRIAYSANLPTPQELLDDVKKNSNLSQTRPENSSRNFGASPALGEKKTFSEQNITTENKASTAILSVDDLMRYLEEHRQPLLEYALKHDVAFEAFAEGNVKISVGEKVGNDLVMSLHKVLTEATGKKWQIDIVRGKLGETIADKENAKAEENKKNVMEYPLVRAIMEEFRGAKIETLTRKVSQESTDENSPEDNNDLIFE